MAVILRPDWAVADRRWGNIRMRGSSLLYFDECFFDESAPKKIGFQFDKVNLNPNAAVLVPIREPNAASACVALAVR